MIMDEKKKIEIESMLNASKSKGIETSLIRKDGILIHSTVTLDETLPNIVSSIANITDELMKQSKDNQKEIEVTIDNVYFVIIPVKEYLLCSPVTDRELKKELRALAEQVKGII
jgi:hypothetical protein